MNARRGWPWRALRLLAAVALTATQLASVPPAAAAPAAALGAGNRVRWQGGDWYLHGVNVPWVNWGCDFGCGAGSGASSAGSQSLLTDGFRRAAAGGMRTVRWWVFPGEPWQITRDGSGRPTGVDGAVYQDFDAALRLAEAHDLSLVFVLFSGPTSVPQSWLTDAGQRGALATALGPLFARYRGHPRLLAWEVFNEPEFDIWSGKVAQAPVQATVKAIADAVHANSTAYVTVGSAMLDGLPMWVGQGLDFYQAHWYDYMSSGDWCARCTDYAAVRARYGLDGPLVIGEVYIGPDVDAGQRFADFYAKGYAGAWPWSLFADRTNDKMTVDYGAAQAFAAAHGDTGPRGGGGAPPAPTAAPPSPTRTPPPPPATATATATATAAPPSPTRTPPPATPTATTAPPAPTATGTTPGGQAPRFSSSADASPDAVAPGQPVSLTVPVRSETSGSWLVDVEVYDPSGRRVHQKWFDDQSFRAGQTRRFRLAWDVPSGAAAGTYTVRVGVFSVGWGTLHAWNASAGRFTVAR
jgi:hypothetical protein